ncbi:MAG TPA: hypothetical protein VE291_02165 [Terracidiphilus sp.]|nr:hypothetical protein [Terracidiphilus sp.]
MLVENSGAGTGDFALSALDDKGCIHPALAASKPSPVVSRDQTLHWAVGAYAVVPLDVPLDTGDCRFAHLPHAETTQISYAWQIVILADDKAKIPRHAESFGGMIAVGPVTVTSDFADFSGRYLSAANQFFKDFSWPLALAVLGYVVQYYLARRGERQQIFATLLPSFTELVQTHYLPIVRRIRGVNLEASRINPNAPEQAIQRIFAASLLMRRRFLHLLNLKGGIFFRSAVAEELFDSCFSKFYLAFRNATGDPSMCEELALSLKPEDTLTEAQSHLFSFRMATDTNLLYPKFAKWAAGATPPATAASLTPEFKGYLALLALGQAVLNFECDRIFYQSEAEGSPRRWNWYFDPPQFEFQGRLEGVTDPRARELCELLTKYLNGIPKECRIKTGYPRLENDVVVVREGSL